MSLSTQLEEAAGLSGRMDRKTKQAINKALEKAGFGGRARFRSVGEALNVASGVLEKNGVEWGQVNSAHLFSAKTGHQAIRLAQINPTDAFSPVDITNTSLGFQWTTLEPGRYEVIAYLG